VLGTGAGLIWVEFIANGALPIFLVFTIMGGIALIVMVVLCLAAVDACFGHNTMAVKLVSTIFDMYKSEQHHMTLDEILNLDVLDEDE